MPPVTIAKRQSHLEFYQQHGIAPVRYDLSSMGAHFDRRRSLYNKLGLTALAFAGSKVLEVAAGTGHNSLYVAIQKPDSLVLLEPNPTCIEHIGATYADFRLPHTAPQVVTQKLEEFYPDETFDVVLCENWLGTSEHELGLFSKLASFVKPGGILVVTTVSPIGFVPNLLRRFFASHLASPKLPFARRTEILEEAYAPHLSSLGSMTRNVTDWVHDNMVNPAYFGLCLSAPAVLTQLGDQYEALGSYPSFLEDWRWFKELHGQRREMNQHFLSEYWRKCHNFLDSRHLPSAGDSTSNHALEDTSLRLLKAIEASEDAVLQGQRAEESLIRVADQLRIFIDQIPPECSQAKEGLEEIYPLIDDATHLKTSDIAGLTRFNGLFGRETSYLSLQRV